MSSEITKEDVERAAVRAVAVRTKQEIQLETRFGEKGLEIANLAQLKNFAQEIIESGLAPAGIDSPGKALLCIQVGRELGFSPARSLQAIVPVKGKATLTGEAALALIRSSGLLEPGTSIEIRHERREGEGLTCVVRSRRRGEGWVETTFSEEDATQAGLIPAMKWDSRASKMVPNADSPWQKYRKRMLMWRAVGFHAKDYWSDVCHGLMLDAEARDLSGPSLRDVTPIRTEERPPAVDPLFPDLPSQPILDAQVVGEEPGQADELEIDPETGEVIPPGVGVKFD